jgi:hypothetical protein
VAAALAAMPQQGRQELGTVVHYMIAARTQPGVTLQAEFFPLMVAFLMAKGWSGV